MFLFKKNSSMLPHARGNDEDLRKCVGARRLTRQNSGEEIAARQRMHLRILNGQGNEIIMVYSKSESFLKEFVLFS